MLKRAQSSWHKARMKAAEAVKTKKFARHEASALYGGKERDGKLRIRSAGMSIRDLIGAATNTAPPNINSSDDMRWYARLLPGLAPAVREGSTACVIGKYMYLFGGMGGSGGGGDAGRSNELWRCPLQEYGKWEIVNGNGPAPPPRSGHSASVVAGEMWVYGGEGAYNGLNRRDIFGDLRAYDPKSNTWRNLEVMGGPPYNLLPPARRGHTATVVKTVTRQQLVIFGGRGLDRVFGQDVFFNDLQVMDVPSMMWLEMATDGPVPLPRSGHTATYMASNETIVVIGGLSSRIVATRKCPRSNNKQPMPQFVGASMSVAGLPSGTALQATTSAARSGSVLPSPSGAAAAGTPGSRSGDGDSDAVFASDDVYTLDTRIWRWTKHRPAGEGPGRVYGHGAAAHPDSSVEQLFLFGGRKPSRRDSTRPRLFVLDTSTITWSSPATGGPMPKPRYSHVMVQGDQCIIVFGGSNFDSYSNVTVHQLLLPNRAAKDPPPPPPQRRRLIRLRSPAPVRGQTVIAAGPETHGSEYEDVTPSDQTAVPRHRYNRFGGQRVPPSAEELELRRRRLARQAHARSTAGLHQSRSHIPPAAAGARGKSSGRSVTSRPSVAVPGHGLRRSMSSQPGGSRARPKSALPRRRGGGASAGAPRSGFNASRGGTRSRPWSASVRGGRAARAGVGAGGGVGEAGEEPPPPVLPVPPAPMSEFASSASQRDMANYVEPLHLNQTLDLRSMMHRALGLDGVQGMDGVEVDDSAGNGAPTPASVAADDTLSGVTSVGGFGSSVGPGGFDGGASRRRRTRSVSHSQSVPVLASAGSHDALPASTPPRTRTPSVLGLTSTVIRPRCRDAVAAVASVHDRRRRSGGTRRSHSVAALSMSYHNRQRFGLDWAGARGRGSVWRGNDGDASQATTSDGGSADGHTGPRRRYTTGAVRL